MLIHFVCGNGHRLRVRDKYAGRQVVCPKCQDRVVVPSAQGRKVSDSSIVALMPRVDPQQTVVTRSRPTVAPPRLRTCPKCRQAMSIKLQICPHCKLYLPGAPTDDEQSAAWACGECGTTNLPGDLGCRVCGQERPVASA